MDLIKRVAADILDISKNIFQINERFNSPVIFKDNNFLISGEKVIVEKCHKEKSSYYFEHPEIDGVIIKKENDTNYCIKASVVYINNEGNRWCFAKIRIDNYFGEVHIKGRRTGSWEMHDFEDDDFIRNPDFELSLVLDSMKNSLGNMYEELYKNTNFDSDKYNPKWVKQIKKYNN